MPFFTLFLSSLITLELERDDEINTQNTTMTVSKLKKEYTGANIPNNETMSQYRILSIHFK